MTSKMEEGARGKIFTIAQEGHNLIVTGQCGTGKTVLMREIIDALRDKDRIVAVTATTGMAAQNYPGGTTLHNWCGIGDCRHAKADILTAVMHTSTAEHIRQTDVLVVDEIGMLSAATLETVEYVCRHVRQVDVVFGGMQVITCGDFKQLPPVPNLRHNDPGRHCFTSPIFHEAFPHRLNLTDVKRQDEPELVKAVRELCDGDPSVDTNNFLASLDRPIEGDATLLFGTNFDADFVNQEKLDDLVGEQRLYRATDSGDRNKLKTSPAPKVLALKVGAPVILTRNLHSLLCNGTQGTVHSVESRPIVNFHGKLITLEQYRFDIYDSRQRGLQATRMQFPLKLAFALTVHRAQGQTLPCVEVDCYSFFAAGQLGVAIGRSVSSSTLRLVNYNEHAATIKHVPEVYTYYNTMCVSECISDLSCCKAKPFLNDSNVDVEPEASKSHPTVTPNSPQLDIGSFSAVNPLTINAEKLNAHVGVIQKTLIDLHTKDATTQTYKELNTFLLSDSHMSMLRDLFESDTISKAQNKYATKLVFRLDSQLVERQAAAIASSQRVTANACHTSEQQCTLTDAAKAKIRYVAGACLSTITGRLRVKAVANITGTSNKASRRAAYKKHMLLSKFRTSEVDTVANTTIHESLSEIDAKQGSTRGLYHMSDETYNFFVHLNAKAYHLLCKDTFDVEGENAFIKCREDIVNGAPLNQVWSSLLLTEDIDEVHNDLQERMCHELFAMVSEHFLRIQFVDALHRLKESIPKKKKMALRAKVQGATKECAFKKRQHSNEAEGEYLCPTCKKVCPDNPQTPSDFSIGCDTCNRWYHQNCQGVVDSTKLKVWKCSACKQIKRRH